VRPGKERLRCLIEKRWKKAHHRRGGERRRCNTEELSRLQIAIRAVATVIMGAGGFMLLAN
jgi:hypothetical protein